ncbi:MAG: endonuclease domain-containing protein [Pseudomonadota bacterium]|jgi:very-short-patch-repair endonuclease|nr:endonuclease domain-containing protein [Syntrophaceae bacterium]MBP7033528.1 endonuclease domain-containing protein [Syntrophobacterales bacterium]MDI9556398.1 endonuclease domain-containing protein [Pseudomonadota bacterium]NLX30122.1 endonuclease domain-containing protein [Deltaproteobacteria bacterium]HNU85625.1 endonuclease domain-containing protein [Syntrophales bacterium]
MFLAYEGKLKVFSRELRTHMTDAEKALWIKLRRKQLKGYQFYRQKIIGDYIVDFYCPGARLVVEVDGGQHYGLEEMAKDRVRDKYLREQGLEVLRFSDREVLIECESVLEKIYVNLP